MITSAQPAIVINTTVKADFPRYRRIIKTDEFSSVFRLRPAKKTAHFVLYTRTNSHGFARLGIVAAKRLAPCAVTRNTIKRITREVFRLHQADAASYWAQADCVIRLARPLQNKQLPARNITLKRLIMEEIRVLFAKRQKVDGT